MVLRYVNRLYTVCYLVLFLAISAVADISLDYYYDNKELHRSVGPILAEDCDNADTRDHCYQKCGTNIACLLGQYFYLKVRALSEAEEGKKGLKDKDVTEEKSCDEENTGTKDFDEEEGNELKPPYNYEAQYSDEEIVDQRPALRHHIAHFCPNLDKARVCIRKCMKLGLPAFCGKDHVCYCRHNYPNSYGEPKIDPGMVHNQFKDLYEKYFGKKNHGRHRTKKITSH